MHGLRDGRSQRRFDVVGVSVGSGGRRVAGRRHMNRMCVSRMSERCPHSPLRGTGWLQGWRLTFGGEDHGWDGALATVVQDASSAMSR